MGLLKGAIVQGYINIAVGTHACNWYQEEVFFNAKISIYICLLQSSFILISPETQQFHLFIFIIKATCVLRCHSAGITLHYILVITCLLKLACVSCNTFKYKWLAAAARKITCELIEGFK